MDAADIVFPEGTRKGFRWADDQGAYIFTAAGRIQAALWTPDLVIEKGQSLSLPIRYLDASAQTVDLSSGFTGTWTLTSGSHAGALSVVVPTVGTLTFGGAEQGQVCITIAMTAAQTAAITFTRGLHAFVLTETATGLKTRLFEGVVVCRP